LLAYVKGVGAIVPRVRWANRLDSLTCIAAKMACTVV
jgi:hypothetical protein